MTAVNPDGEPIDSKRMFMEDVLTGLSQQQPEIPCKYLYDERGSALFEQIGDTDEYYVTRADLALHHAHLRAIADCIGEQAHIIEFGSGAGTKIQLILSAARQPRAYTPIEISIEALEASVAALRQRFPHLDIQAVNADYTRDIPDEILDLNPPARRRLVYFPGSTISNFSHQQAQEFLSRMRCMIGVDGGILIGVDLIKPKSVLESAYDDASGITAAFNLNLLERLQNDLSAQLQLEDFRHEARYNQDQERIEMHLVAVRDTQIKLNGSLFSFNAGQSIHTENSHKYSIPGFSRLAEQAGLAVIQTWTDPEQLFSMHYLEPSAT